MSAEQNAIIAAIRRVHDPEIPVNLYDLGLIYRIDMEDGHVSIDMTLTTPNCPVADSMPQKVRQEVLTVDGVDSADVRIVWEPAWTPERMSPAARLELDMHEPADLDRYRQGNAGGSATTGLTVGRRPAGGPPGRRPRRGPPR